MTSFFRKCGFPSLPRHAITAIFFLLFILLVIFIVRGIIKDSDVVLLNSEQGAEWIRYPEPTALKARKNVMPPSLFHYSFEVIDIPARAIMKFRTLKTATIWLNKEKLFESESNENWKELKELDLAPHLFYGSNHLYISVQNKYGHPALLAYCKEVDLFTGPDWTARKGKRDRWVRALRCNEKHTASISSRFKRADHVLFEHANVFFPLFFIVFLVTLIYPKLQIPRQLESIFFTSKGLRWVLLGSWCVLAINNFDKIPYHIGMDIRGHMEYVAYVVKNTRIPLATDGWQMFQAPLFYVISSFFYGFFSFCSVEQNVANYLRMLPLLCGGIQIELCYRALKLIYSGREDLQALGIVVGGLLPVNIYMSQVVGNEPMAGCLSAVTILLVFHLLCKSSAPSTRYCASIGLFLGLAILSKINAVLLVFPVLFFTFYKIFTTPPKPERALGSAVRRTVLIAGLTVSVSGWYFIRNYIELGKFFVGGWDPIRKIVWWQDPAYRTVQDFLRFGDTLYYPIYSSLSGVWDSLYSTFWMDGGLSGIAFYRYRPPWNYDFLLSSAWLSLLPCMAIFLGGIFCFRKINRHCIQPQLFAVCCIFIYISAVLCLYLKIPIYSTAKASYMLGLIPCFTVLCANGFDIMLRNQFLRAFVYGVIACWAFGSYATYFVL